MSLAAGNIFPFVTNDNSTHLLHLFLLKESSSSSAAAAVIVFFEEKRSVGN